MNERSSLVSGISDYLKNDKRELLKTTMTRLELRTTAVSPPDLRLMTLLSIYRSLYADFARH